MRPGVNKLREVLEWIDEIAGRDGISPAAVIRRDDIQRILNNKEPRYSNLREILFALRHPNLDALRKEVWLALDKLKIAQGTKIKTDENFEKDQIRVELEFQTLEELQEQIDKLSAASRSEVMKNLIKTFQTMK